jgi:hypothetical protein
MSLVEEAEKLLGADKVTTTMADYLKRVEDLVRQQGGVPMSRQIVGLAIATAEELDALGMGDRFE